MNEIIITKIEWERIVLRIYINFSNGKQFGLFNDKKNRFMFATFENRSESL